VGDATARLPLSAGKKFYGFRRGTPLGSSGSSHMMMFEALQAFYIGLLLGLAWRAVSVHFGLG
jgi:hypothetical protein